MADPEKFLPKRSPEHGSHTPESSTGERLKETEKTPERSSETASQERAAEQARKDIEVEAVSSKENGTEQRLHEEPAVSSTGAITKLEKKSEYDKTMKSMRTQLPKASQTFSKVIHQPGVEKASEVAGATVARPNAILAGSFTAFIAVLGVYLLAGYNGFRLSGFETIAAFAVGWAAGVVLDLLRVAFSRHRSL